MPALAAAALVAGCGTFNRVPPAPTEHRVEQRADIGLPAAAARALAQRLPALQPISHSSGRLQVDDVDDLAVVLAPPGQAHDAVVALLVTGAGGQYHVASVSKVIAPGCGSCSVSVDIARHLLSVHLLRPADPEFERLTFQFGYRDGGDALRLIGVTAAQPPGDDPIAHGYAISTDLLRGTKVDTLDPTLTEPGRRRERQANIALRPPIAFGDFSFAPEALGAELHREPMSAFGSAEALPAGAATLLRSHFPGLAVRARSTGPLRSDNLRDVAVVLAPASHPDGKAPADGGTLLALLFAQPDGSLRLAATAGPLTRDCAGCDVQLQIAHRALVVQTSARDAGGSRLVGWQFAATPGDPAGGLRLVGVRTVIASRSASGDSHRDVITANLLTGDKLEVVDDVTQGQRQRAQHPGQVPLRPAIALAGFTFDAGRFDAETRRDFRP